MMTPADRSLTFLWWNLHNFSHFDQALADDRRWPDSEAHYRIRLTHTVDILREISPDGLPDVMAFAEVTARAARDLAEELGGYRHFFPDIPGSGEFQPACLYRANLPASASTLYPMLLPRETRAMSVLDVRIDGHLFRVHAAHWPARFTEQSRVHREELARQLSSEVYSFFTDSSEPTPRAQRHTLILGDLNAEPFESLMAERLYAYRDRRRARSLPTTGIKTRAEFGCTIVVGGCSASVPPIPRTTRGRKSRALTTGRSSGTG